MIPADVAFLTHRGAPEIDGDDAPVADALRRRGLRVEGVPWDAERDWSSAGLALIRSTWDYSRRRDAYLAALSRIAGATRLHNPIAVVARNTDKRYLVEVRSSGLPVIPTVHAAAGTLDLEATLRERGWSDAVVKPAVGAGSWRTYRVRAGEPGHALARARRLARARDVLVQPFVAAVTGPGERALVFLGGQFSHAIRKRSLFEGDGVPPRVACDPREGDLDLARRILEHEGAADLAYARVDVVDGEDGPLLMELELTEPRLFFGWAPPAAVERFADVVEARLRA